MAIDEKKIPKKRVEEKKPSSYQAVPLNDYIERTKIYDSQFDKFFPAAQRDQQVKKDSEFREKYGQFSGNRGWWADIFNQFVPSENRRYGDVVLGVAANQGINPKLLYGSANEEGGFKALHGKQVLGNDGTPEKGYDFNGQVLLGLDTFGSRVDELKKYLPEGFDYKTKVRQNNKGEDVNTAFFKSPSDALTAMTAFLKVNQDNVNNYTKKRGIQLTPEANDFFTMAAYNGGEGNAQKMIEYYKDKGLLKDNAFLKDANLANDKYGKIYENVRRRIDAVDALEKEGELDFSPERIEIAKSGKQSWTKDFSGSQKQVGDYKVLQPTDKKIPFDVVMVGNKRKVVPRNTDISNLDVKSLPDLDVYDYEKNLQLIKPKG